MKLLASALVISTPSLYAQEITINPRSNMVLNGSVHLVLYDAAFQNNGGFSAGSSTVSFTGHHDTTESYVSGSASTSLYNLSITKSDYGVALKSPVIVKNVLAVNDGNLYTDSNLTLRSDASLTARVDVVPAGCSIIGKANVERYFPAKRSWRLLTAPVTNSNTIFNSWQNRGVYAAGIGFLVTGPNPTGAAGNGLDYSQYNNVTMKGFNYATQQFSNVLNTKVAISQGISGSADNTGYFVFVRGDRDPANTTAGVVNTSTLTSIGALQTGTQTFTASPDATKAYTLIGNPYASPVDFNNVTRTNLAKRFYVWDPTLNTLGGYVMIDDTDGDGTFIKDVPLSSQTKCIQSGQAFFVETLVNGPASITFNETNKSGSNNNLVFRPTTPAPTSVGQGQIVATLNLLNADNTTLLADGTLVQFNDLYSAGINKEDALKFANTNETFSVMRNKVSLAAERRPALTLNDTVYYRLTTTTSRGYQFVFDIQGLEQTGLTGILMDSYLGTNTDLSFWEPTVVNFAITADPASSTMNRFKVVFKQSPVVLPVTISSVNAYKRNKNIAVEWEVENEINIEKYDVEKSIDGNTFTNVNTMFATAVNGSNKYEWLDDNAVQGNNFYRIKSYDKNGAIKYSTTVRVTMGEVEAGISIYPNPITGNKINIILDNHLAGEYGLNLTNLAGQLFVTRKVKCIAGNSTYTLNTNHKLPVGIYNLKVTGPDHKQHTYKVIIE
ncbi:MAG: T9SS type A sorting domain-containing protein [Ferruginibacter sp.]